MIAESVAEVYRTAEQPAGVVVASANEDFRAQALNSLSASLKAPWLTAEAVGGAEALGMMESGHWGAVLFDRWLPDLEVEELVRIVCSRHPSVEVFVKDFETGQLLRPRHAPQSAPMRELFAALQNRPQRRRASQNPDRQQTLFEPFPESEREITCSQVLPLPGMVGGSPAMQRVYRLAHLVSRRPTTVLLTGESGTGKELVASAIHVLSPRSKNAWVPINCAAIPEALLESELFGHARGAFTGAVQSRLGRFQAADGGTLFLDEIADLPLTMQAKLLRFLQEGELQRLGNNETIRVDVRVIAATNADLLERVAAGRFREDLYYRLFVFPIEIAPLRDRPQDIASLADHFLKSFRDPGSCPKSISAAARRLLEQYSWPGNVRELRQAIERAFIFSDQEPELRPEHFWLPTVTS